MASFFIIAQASMKRQPVITYPITIFAVYYYIKQTINVPLMLRMFPLALVIFYFGVRLNYTLNPERKVWGSFDTEYLLDYVVGYQFGNEQKIGLNQEDTEGRGGSLGLIWAPHRFRFSANKNLWFGIGLANYVTRQDRGEARFLGDAYGIDHRGLASAAIEYILTIGYLGFATYLLYFLSILRTVSNRRFRLILIIVWLYHILFYGDIIIQEASMSVLVILICFLSNDVLRYRRYRVDEK